MAPAYKPWRIQVSSSIDDCRVWPGWAPRCLRKMPHSFALPRTAVPYTIPRCAGTCTGEAHSDTGKQVFDLSTQRVTMCDQAWTLCPAAQTLHNSCRGYLPGPIAQHRFTDTLCSGNTSVTERISSQSRKIQVKFPERFRMRKLMLFQKKTQTSRFGERNSSTAV